MDGIFLQVKTMQGAKLPPVLLATILTRVLTICEKCVARIQADEALARCARNFARRGCLNPEAGLHVKSFNLQAWFHPREGYPPLQFQVLLEYLKKRQNSVCLPMPRQIFQ